MIVTALPLMEGGRLCLTISHYRYGAIGKTVAETVQKKWRPNIGNEPICERLRETLRDRKPYALQRLAGSANHDITDLVIGFVRAVLFQPGE